MGQFFEPGNAAVGPHKFENPVADRKIPRHEDRLHTGGSDFLETCHSSTFASDEAIAALADIAQVILHRGVFGAEAFECFIVFSTDDERHKFIQCSFGRHVWSSCARTFRFSQWLNTSGVRGIAKVRGARE
jgi:hypothetical protein